MTRWGRIVPAGTISDSPKVKCVANPSHQSRIPLEEEPARHNTVQPVYLFEMQMNRERKKKKKNFCQMSKERSISFTGSAPCEVTAIGDFSEVLSSLKRWIHESGLRKKKFGGTELSCERHHGRTCHSVGIKTEIRKGKVFMQALQESLWPSGVCLCGSGKGKEMREKAFFCVL